MCTAVNHNQIQSGIFNVNVQDSIVNAENRLNQTFSKRDPSQMNEI